MNVWAALLLVLSNSAAEAVPASLESNPRRELLANAVEHGDVDFVRRHLDDGGDANEAWRDFPAQIARSLLLRSVWYGQEEIFRLLLDRGADVASIDGYFIAAVHSQRGEIVRTLLARGVKPGNKQDVLYAALQDQNPAMIDLLWSSDIALGFSPSDLPGYFLTRDVTRLLDPKYVSPNARIGIGNESCDVARILGAYRRTWDGCEGATGPLWLHFVVTADTGTLTYLMEHGVDLTARGDVSTPTGDRSFSAMDIARARRDDRMMQILRRAGAADK